MLCRKSSRPTATAPRIACCIIKRENVVPVALSRFLDEHPSVRKIHLHLDNDAVGRGAVKGIVGGLQGRYQVYDEPPSRGKDVNDELKIRVGLMRERKERERT